MQEIGYTDTIIDVRSNRVRSLLGLHETDVGDENNRCLKNFQNRFFSFKETFTTELVLKDLCQLLIEFVAEQTAQSTVKGYGVSEEAMKTDEVTRPR